MTKKKRKRKNGVRPDWSSSALLVPLACSFPGRLLGLLLISVIVFVYCITHPARLDDENDTCALKLVLSNLQWLKGKSAGLDYGLEFISKGCIKLFGSPGYPDSLYASRALSSSAI